MKHLLMALLIVGLAACAERDQAAPSERSYQGKPDTPAWGNGERAGWEREIKLRQLTQNESIRIHQQ